MDKGRLQGRAAVVTGAGQGLGEAIVNRLVREGARVVAADINAQNVNRVAAATGALAAEVDVTDERAVERMTGRALAEWGRLDLMVCNAGILISGPVTDFAAADWRRVIEVNLVGYFLCARAAARIMSGQKSGVIIDINSKSGKKGSFKNSAYAASKFGGIGLTQSLALELAPTGVRVNAVCPGNLLDSPLWVNSLYEQYARNQGITPAEVRRKYEAQVPLGRGCTYEDVCNVVVFLAGDEAAYMTGQAINVTGGQEMR